MRVRVLYVLQPLPHVQLSLLCSWCRPRRNCGLSDMQLLLCQVRAGGSEQCRRAVLCRSFGCASSLSVSSPSRYSYHGPPPYQCHACCTLDPTWTALVVARMGLYLTRQWVRLPLQLTTAARPTPSARPSAPPVPVRERARVCVLYQTPFAPLYVCVGGVAVWCLPPFCDAGAAPSDCMKYPGKHGPFFCHVGAGGACNITTTEAAAPAVVPEVSVAPQPEGIECWMCEKLEPYVADGKCKDMCDNWWPWLQSTCTEVCDALVSVAGRKLPCVLEHYCSS